MHHVQVLAAALGVVVLAALGAPATAAPAGDDRVSPDHRAGSYTRLVDGEPDAAHAFCGGSRRPQAEPAVAVNPRDPSVIVAGAADQCAGSAYRQYPFGQSQGWLALYRSTDGGSSWDAGLMPGYPGDGTVGWPVQPCGQADATMAFDRQGRLFYGALCPDLKGDHALVDFHITVSTFDQDGSHYLHTADADGLVPAAGNPSSSSDKPNLAVDISDSAHQGNVYVAYSACPVMACAEGPGRIDVATSRDHGKSFSPPVAIPDVPRDFRPNFADVAIGPDGTVWVTATTMERLGAASEVLLSRSTDGGASFAPFQRVAQVQPFNSASFAGTDNGAAAADERQHGMSLPCGDGAFACASGFTFSPIRTLSAVTADDDGVHVAWSAQLPSGQAKVFVQSSADGTTWPTPPVVVDPAPSGHQWYPDIASADGVLRVVFYDSRADSAYAPDLPPGNTRAGASSGGSVDTYEARSHNGGRTWSGRRLSTVSQQPGMHAQLGARVPWLGDYLYVSAVPGGSYAVWADARDVVPGTDARGGDAHGFDVATTCQWLPAREDVPGTHPFAAPLPSSDCLSQGGLDVNVYGAPLHARSERYRKG